jgi:hypothetical protein
VLKLVLGLDVVGGAESRKGSQVEAAVLHGGAVEANHRGSARPISCAVRRASARPLRALQLRSASTGANFVLDTRTGAFDGSVPSFDLGINKHGDMAGNCIVGIDQVGPPCVLIRGHHDDLGSGVIHVIDVDADSAALVAINDHRVAVGNAFNADGSQRAFTWSFTDGVRFLDAPPSTSRFATAINNHGLIAGAIQGDNVSHPTMLSAGSGRIAATLTALNGLALGANITPVRMASFSLSN